MLGTQSLFGGLGFVPIGYLAIGLPDGYVARGPYLESQHPRLHGRIKGVIP